MLPDDMKTKVHSSQGTFVPETSREKSLQNNEFVTSGERRRRSARPPVGSRVPKPNGKNERAR